MSSVSTQATISKKDLKTVYSVLLNAGYSAGSPIKGNYKVDTAVSMLISKIVGGEKDPDKLTNHLARFYGKYSSGLNISPLPLPRFAIQGLPKRVAK